MQHLNARLTPTGRLQLVKLVVEDEMTLQQAAACCNVAKSTAHTWVSRWRKASEAQRQTLACMHDRSSRPHRSPRLLDQALQQRICETRRHTGWGPRLVGGATGHPHSTVWKVLARHGLSRRPRPKREPANRYEWPCPGDLLHMDVSTYARFETPGHAVTGDRTRPAERRRVAAGYDYAHAIVDDHTRLAYVELHRDEKAQTVTGFVERALEWFKAQGITTKRMMSDNAWVYTKNSSLRSLFAQREIRHLTTKPYRPRTNGKVERFHQTMAREWAYGLAYRSSDDRRRALPHWLDYYNEQRPHSSLGDRPPISRVRNLCG